MLDRPRGLRDRGNRRRAGGWFRKCMGEAAIVPHPLHRTPVPACDRHVRRIVSLRQLAVQQGVDPHIGTPPAIRGVWLRLGTRQRPRRGSPLGGQLQRLFEGPGRHDVVIEPPGVRVLSHHDVEPLLRLGTRRRLGRDGPLGGGLQRLFARPRGGRLFAGRGVWLRLGIRRRPGRGGPLGGQLQRLFGGFSRHDVVIEPPGIRVLSHRNVEQWHRSSILLGTGSATGAV